MKNISQIFFAHCLKMDEIKATIGNIAGTDLTILIRGESGTGKKLVAQTIHLNSPRQKKAFIRVNCAAIPQTLLESELFGFEKGAFTGAHLKKPGKFELADGGTILLDEIGDLDISIQAKLLQVLQDGEFSRLGGDGNVVVDTRVVTTTKNKLEESILEGRFRKDLFFRINIITIAVPPLRERRGQILPLARYFFDVCKAKYAKAIPFYSPETLRILQEYDWPGNIRELENMVKRTILFGEEEAARGLMGNLCAREGKPSSESSIQGNPDEKESLNIKTIARRAAEEAEKKTIRETLRETHWNRRQSSKLLGVSYKSLLQKIQKYRLNEVPGFQLGAMHPLAGEGQGEEG